MVELNSPLLWLALGALLILGVWVGSAWSSWRVRRRIARHRALGRLGEARALGLLDKAGYQIESEQASSHLEVIIDGARQTCLVRADFIVRKRGKRYVAETKGGEVSASLTTAATRRQLLEYTLAFDTDGVLLVDAARGEIHEVSFPQR